MPNERWRKNNREKLRKQAKQYTKEHPEYKKQYHENHKEEEAAYNKEWRKKNKEKKVKYMKQYRQSVQGKIGRKKDKAIRRELGFLPINKPFEGCEGHHISENFVIYIPMVIHKSIWHNIWTWRGMEKMNKLAIECL